jgi:hypothetical protein
MFYKSDFFSILEEIHNQEVKNAIKHYGDDEDEDEDEWEEDEDEDEDNY